MRALLSNATLWHKCARDTQIEFVTILFFCCTCVDFYTFDSCVVFAFAHKLLHMRELLAMDAKNEITTIGLEIYFGFLLECRLVVCHVCLFCWFFVSVSKRVMLSDNVMDFVRKLFFLVLLLTVSRVWSVVDDASKPTPTNCFEFHLFF